MQSQDFFENDKTKIIAQRRTDAVVVIGKGFKRASSPVSATFIPSDQRFPLLHHCYLRNRRAFARCELFGVREEGATESGGLKFRGDGQH